jgi:hypothetical protein
LVIFNLSLLIFLVLNVRKSDILRRKELKNEKKVERDKLINDKEEREKRKEAEREVAMKDAEPNPDNPDAGESTFDEEAFLATFDAKDPDIIIPEEIEMDIDDDFEVEDVVVTA